MGQQHYEAEIQRAVRALAPAVFNYVDLRVTSLRSRLHGRRTPRGLNQVAPLPLALGIGAATYRSRGLVHRLDLRLPPHAGPEVVTAHDLPPMRFDDEGLLPRSVAAGARRARYVITPSDFAAQELRELLGVERTITIPYGLSAPFDDPQPAPTHLLEQHGIRSPFLLHAAGTSTRKNLAGLAGAWREVSQRHPGLQLVLCGPPDRRRDDLFCSLPGVVKVGRVPSDTIAGLMCRSEAVVVPSLYEGFGLPALEGMACGVPVVAAARGALPEVCGGAALLVEPDEAALAEGLLRVLDDAADRARLIAAGRRRAAAFSWDRAAREHVKVYQAALQA